MKLVNLCRHDIVIYDVVQETPNLYHIEPDAEVVQWTIKPSGTVARVDFLRSEEDELVNNECGSIARVPTYSVEEGPITGLPDPEPGVVYITSAMVAQRVCRPDVMSPGPAVVNSEGKPVGCRGLQRWPAQPDRTEEAVKKAVKAANRLTTVLVLAIRNMERQNYTDAAFGFMAAALLVKDVQGSHPLAQQVAVMAGYQGMDYPEVFTRVAEDCEALAKEPKRPLAYVLLCQDLDSLEITHSTQRSMASVERVVRVTEGVDEVDWLPGRQSGRRVCNGTNRHWTVYEVHLD